MSEKHILIEDEYISRKNKKILQGKAGSTVTIISKSDNVVIVEGEGGNRYSVPSTNIKIADPTDLKTR